MIITIERFTQQAVNQNLSAGAILLWQRLYCTMQRKGQFADVHQHTAVLMASLKISRQGLQQMRQMLVDKGFLAVRMDEQQQIYYTLMLGGKVVGEKSGNSQSDGAGHGTVTGGCGQPSLQSTKLGYQKNNMPTDIAAGCASAPATITANAAQSSTDIILTNRYRQYIDAFCDKFGPAPKADLLQWAEMRVKHGWTLTLWGLEAVLKKLIALSGGDAMQMGKIVSQSVKRRWKGFFPISVKAQPSGEKLLRQEQKQQRAQQRSYGHGQATQKFAPEGRDLSFLEK